MGFVTADQLVDACRPAAPGFSRLKLWVLVAAELLPFPDFDLPVKPRGRGLFLDFLSERLADILLHPELTVGDARQALRDYDYTAGAEHQTAGNLRVIPPSEHPSSLQMAHEHGEPRRHCIDGDFTRHSPLFHTYLAQLYHPADMIGKIAKLIGEDDCVVRKTDERSELQLASLAISVIAHEQEIAALTVAELLGIIDQAVERLQGIQADYLAWHDEVGAAPLAEAAAREEEQALDGLLIRKDHSHKLNKFVRGISLFKFSGIMLVLFCLLIVQARIVKTGVFQYIFGIAFAVFCIYLAYSVFSSLFRILVRGKRIGLVSIWDTIDYFIGVVLAYASAYYLLYQSEEIATSVDGKLAPFDFIYFSIVTVTTTGFGDILPHSSIARLIVCSEIIFGVLFTLIIVGLVISRFSRDIEGEGETHARELG